VGKQGTDISLIRKYLNGELDARAMHRLERRAQDDPFLMDALEGYQKARADQRANLEELASRLNERVSEKRQRIIPFRAIGIAASVLIVCSAGIWLYQGRTPERRLVKNESGQTEKVSLGKAAADTLNKKTSAPAPYAKNVPAAPRATTDARQALAQPAVAADKTVTPPIVNQPAPAQAVLADTKAAQPAAQDSTPLNEVIVMNYKSSKKKDTAGPIMLHETRIALKRDTGPQQRLQANVPGVKVYYNRQSAADLNKLMAQGNLGTLGFNQLLTNRIIEGKVISENNGLPVQGAQVKVSGTNQATKTDAHGFFRILADTNHAKLEITNPGYKASQVNAGINTRDSVKTIILAPDESDDLGETIVNGYTSQPRDANETYITAHPQKGWSAFRRYLKINAIAPDGAAGIVKLTFSVDKYGSVSNIKVVKGLSDAANKKAASLVKDGPDWVGNSNKKPETITLRIRFGK